MKRLAALAALLFVACASVGPDYTRPDVGLPPAWQAAAPATAPAGDPAAWWRSFNDPLLARLVAQAQTTSTDAQTAAARLRAARARRSSAAAGRYPSLSASGTGQRSRSQAASGDPLYRSNYGAGLDAAWELDVFGGVRRGVEAADADLASAEENLHDAQVSLAAEVALSYVDVRTFQERLRIAMASLASQAETVQLTTWRAQAGLVNEQDVAQAVSSLEQTRAQIPSLAQSLTEAEHALDVLAGRAPGALHAELAAYAAFPTASTHIAVGVPAEVLRRRPDVRAAERRLAAATARIGVARAALYPAFRLSGSIGLEALALASLGDGTVTSSLLGGITAPLFAGGRLRAEAAAQEAARDEALAAYRQAVLAALQDVENALVALSSSDERLAALTRAQAAARTAAELARQRYAAGLIDFQSVLTTERTLLGIEDALATTRADGTRSVIRLYKALGGGWNHEVSP